MSIGSRADRIATSDLEKWLTNALVPIEPSARFVKRLKAKLIRFHGNRPFSVWVIVGSLAMAMMLLLTWFGLALKIILFLFSLIGVFDRKRKTRNKSATIPVGGN